MMIPSGVWPTTASSADSTIAAASPAIVSGGVLRFFRTSDAPGGLDLPPVPDVEHRRVNDDADQWYQRGHGSAMAGPEGRWRFRSRPRASWPRAIARLA